MIYICLTEDFLFLKLNGLDDLLQRVKNMWQRKVINHVKTGDTKNIKGIVYFKDLLLSFFY